MKKEIVLPTTAWLGGIVGFALRRWEMAVAYNPQLRLMETVPATWLLWGLSGALLVLFALACRGMGKGSYPEQWFYAPSTGYILLMVCAGFVLMASGLAVLWQQRGMPVVVKMQLLTGVLCLAGGLCVLPAGQIAYRGQWSKNTPLLLMGPSFATLVWLIVCYQSNARQPQMGLYVWQMLSAVAVVLAVYTLVTLSMGRGGAGRVCLFSLMGISLSVTTLADGHAPAVVLVYLFALLYLTANSWMLLRAAFGQPWRSRMCTETDEQAQTEE